MKPTSITLEKTNTHFQLKVCVPEALRGYTVIESVQIKDGLSLPTLRKHGFAYAKRFGIKFSDKTA